MILEAFWKGDLDEVRGHVDDHVFQTFSDAVEQRKKDQLALDNRLVVIEQAVIAEAAVDRNLAVLTVRFEADIAAVTRNAEGEVVAGSLSDAVQTRELWTFRRDLSTRDPDSGLSETDEEECPSRIGRSRSLLFSLFRPAPQRPRLHLLRRPQSSSRRRLH